MESLTDWRGNLRRTITGLQSYSLATLPTRNVNQNRYESAPKVAAPGDIHRSHARADEESLRISSDAMAARTSPSVPIHISTW
jgi:hypothetical protein